MSSFHERLKEARINAGYSSAREAAETFGWNYSTYASHENGVRGVRTEQVLVYARAFRTDVTWLLGTRIKEGSGDPMPVSVPVVGKAAAGVWLEIDHYSYEDHEPVPAIPSKAFPLAKQIAFKLEGSSMNKVLPDGCYAIGVTVETSRMPRHGDIVAVQRTRGGLMERTIKRYVLENGSPQLFPESTDPRYQAPIVLESHEDDTEVNVLAIIIGMYQPL